jgi:hypothetical protein
MRLFMVGCGVVLAMLGLFVNLGLLTPERRTAIIEAGNG